MNSLKWAAVTPAWSSTPESCLADILFDAANLANDASTVAFEILIFRRSSSCALSTCSTIWSAAIFADAPALRCSFRNAARFWTS